jgi:hypothetical protein
MPPRFVFWTILIDGQPTAFRAAHREELQPTFAQLKRTNTNVVMKWFARGQLWDTPEQAQWAARNVGTPREKRDRDWRPGGEHRDPRAPRDHRKNRRPEDQKRRDARRDAQPRADTQRAPQPRDTRPWKKNAPGGRRGWQPKGSSAQTRQRPQLESRHGGRDKPRREDRGRRPPAGLPNDARDKRRRRDRDNDDK